MSTFGNPAESLLDKTLEGGWKVIEMVKKKPGETGGHFSVCYLVEKDKKIAFLKAIDLSDALNQTDSLIAINQMTTAFLFKRELLDKCKGKHLSKIVMPLDHGQVIFSEQSPYDNVYYIIFELADSNLRNQIARMRVFDLAWILRSLHHTAVALEQLHKSGIAHQDLKPSNVLIFNKESKVGDLGHSSDINIPSANDKYKVPGDHTYAPFELLYGFNAKNDFQLRYASDLFHLGSLVFFYFLHVNLQEIICLEIEKHDILKNLTRTDFYADLPFFQEGFTYALNVLSNEIKKYSNDLCNDIIPLVKMLCEIDPYKRGHIENRRTNINQYSLERFISSFDLIAKKAEYKFYEHD
jgi:eukaryotic-like serine/threonine-protein kinase